MCMFVDEWICKVEGEEKPLEVCKVCIKAKRVGNKMTKAKMVAEESMVEEEVPSHSQTQGEASKERSENVQEEIRDIMETTSEDVEAEKSEEEISSEKPIDDLKNIADKLEAGSVYILETEEEEEAYEFLSEMNSSEEKVLFVSRKYPPKLTDKYDVELEYSLWLSSSNDPLAVDPSELETLSLEMEVFLSEEGDFIFIEGLDSLFANNPESTIIQLFQSIEDQLATSKTSLIFAVSPSSMEEKHLTLINKKLNVKKVPEFETKRKEPVPSMEKEEPVKKEVNEPLGSDESWIEEDIELLEEDREAKREALKELDEEFHRGDITVDEYISKRAVLTTPEQNMPKYK